MILHSINEVQSAKDYELNIEYKNMMLNYRVETLNDSIFDIKQLHKVRLTNSEKKQVKKYITNLINNMI